MYIFGFLTQEVNGASCVNIGRPCANFMIVRSQSGTDFQTFTTFTNKLHRNSYSGANWNQCAQQIMT